MRKIWLIVGTVVALLPIFAFTPNPPSVTLRHWLGQRLADAGHLGLAREVYRSLMLNGDPLGANNYAVLRHWDWPSLEPGGLEHAALMDEVLLHYSYAHWSGVLAGSYNLGMMYFQREYQPASYAFAKEHLAIAMQGGDETAKLAYALNMFVLSNHPDYPEKVAVLEELVKAGNVIAMLELANCMHGDGAQDREMELLRRAAELGNFYALEEIAIDGGFYAPEGNEWLAFAERAALAGSHAAQLRLGRAYKYGFYGVTADKAKAAKWLELAASARNVRPPEDQAPVFDPDGFKWRVPIHVRFIDSNTAENAAEELGTLDAS